MYIQHFACKHEIKQFEYMPTQSFNPFRFVSRRTIDLKYPGFLLYFSAQNVRPICVFLFAERKKKNELNVIETRPFVFAKPFKRAKEKKKASKNPVLISIWDLIVRFNFETQFSNTLKEFLVATCDHPTTAWLTVLDFAHLCGITICRLLLFICHFAIFRSWNSFGDRKEKRDDVNWSSFWNCLSFDQSHSIAIMKPIVTFKWHKN